MAALPAIVDERGTLTYKQVDDQSWALAHGLKGLGVTAGSVVAVLCRDHRGLVLAMAAGQARRADGADEHRLRQAPVRRGLRARERRRGAARQRVLGLLDAVPTDMPRMLTWVDDGAEVARGHADPRRHHRGEGTEPLPPPTKAGWSGHPHQRHHRDAERRAARHGVTARTAQIVDRIPFPRKGTMVMASPIFHGTGWAIRSRARSATRWSPAGGSTRRRRSQIIAEHRAEMLVVVPTMLHRIVELGADVIAKYDTSSLKVILRRVGADPRLVQRGRRNVRRRPLQPVRLHRVRRRDGRHSGGAARRPPAPRAAHR